MAIVGFIGLSQMGTLMTANLVKHGHRVLGFDFDSAAINMTQESSIELAPSLINLAKTAEIIVIMLHAENDVKNICESSEGLFNNLSKHSLVIDCSSISVEMSRYLAQQAYDKGMRMVDAPFLGGGSCAKTGTLTFLVGGNEAEYQAAYPILSSMGKTVIHAGPSGNGQAAKICNNMLLGISMIGVSEAFILAKKLGLSAEKFFEISSNASGQCWAMSNYCPVPGILLSAPANHDYQPGFNAAMMLKDLQLSQQAAQTVNTSTPLSGLATSLYALFNQQGNADLDFSAIIKMFEKTES